MVVLELPQKSDDGESLAAWARELQRLRNALRERLGARITDCRIRETIGVMNRERALRRRLAEFMRLKPPPLTGRQLLDLKSSISGLHADFEQYRRAIAILEERGPDPRLASRVRVLLTGVPIVHGAERVVELIEHAGGLVVCAESCTGLKPILEDVDAQALDPVWALARKYYHLPCSVMTRNDRRFESLRALAAEYQPDCVIELVWQACLTYDVESHAVKQLVEEELGLPYLKIVTDYSPSDSARLSVRIEALYEMVRARQPARQLS